MSASPLELAASRRIVLHAIDEWTERGWLRRLDAAFARFVADLCPSADGSVLLVVALLANVEGQGHACLPIDDLFADREALLGWEAEALDSLAAVMADLPSIDGWLAALHGCAAVHFDGVAHGEGRPLVLAGNALYLRRYWTYERRVAADLARRSDDVEVVDEAAARLWLDRLFPVDASTDRTLDWQKVACAIALRGRLTIVTGGPGTGKTWTAARCLALLFAMSPDPESLRVALAAPTGKAAARLRLSIEGALDTLESRLGDGFPLRGLASHIGPAKTLHALLRTRPGTRRFLHDAANPLDVDVVVVDEASMVHVEMMDALLAALPRTTRVVLLGDKDQLASVEAGAVLGELCRDADAGRYLDDTRRYVEAVTGERVPDAWAAIDGPPLAQRTVMLRRSQRFDGDIGSLALAVNDGDVVAAMRLLTAAAEHSTRLVVASSSHAVEDVAVAGHRDYLALVRRGPGDAEPDAWARDVLRAFDRFRILCAVREGEWGVAGLNAGIRSRLADEKLVSASGEWYEGRPVLVTRNDYGLGVYNGDVGIALRRTPGDAALRACFVDGDTVRSISVSRLAQVETAYAMTVHKSQGSEFDHTVLVLPPDAHATVTRELVYTGVTRARTRFTLVTPDRDALAAAIGRTTRRSSGLLGMIEREAATASKDETSR